MLLHVSGHPSQAELELMYKWTKPKMLLPVHGEFYHLAAHKDLGSKKSIVSEFTHNGHLYECSSDSIKNVMRADVKVFGLDGKRVVPMSSRVFSARDRLSNNGIVTVSVAGGSLAQVMHYGLWEDDDLDKGLRACADRSVNSNSSSPHAEMISAIKGDVAHWVRTHAGKNPVVLVLSAESGGGRRKQRSSRSHNKWGAHPNANVAPNGNTASQEDVGGVNGNSKRSRKKSRKEDDSANTKSANAKSANTKESINAKESANAKDKDPYVDVIAKYMDD